MSISMYQAAVPTIIRALKNLADVTAKGAQHVDGKKIPPEAIMNFRLYPDMLPFTKQIQIASDVSKGGCARLAGVEAPSFEDNEASFPELIERLRKTVAFLETLKPEQMDGAESRTITWTVRGNERSMVGLQYLFTHTLPNVFFHCATAYDILRHNGVELGKMDFLGRS
jgi:uncharacterized protein